MGRRLGEGKCFRKREWLMPRMQLLRSRGLVAGKFEPPQKHVFSVREDEGKASRHGDGEGVKR